jgi:hypothetical protein
MFRLDKKYNVVFLNSHLVAEFGLSQALTHPAIKGFTFVGGCDTLEEAKKLRKVSGDIVIDPKKVSIVKDEAWLWDWEKEKKEASYAWKLIHN